jgi:hypothetical protein
MVDTDTRSGNSSTFSRSGRPSIFLSYSSRDREFARRLCTDLERSGVAVWLDEAELRIGDSIIVRIAEAIAGVDFLVVLLSPASVESVWVKRELELALSLEIERKLTGVLPILVEKCQIPAPLVGRVYADFTDSSLYAGRLNLLLRSIDVESNESISADGDLNIECVSSILAARFPNLGPYSDWSHIAALTKELDYHGIRSAADFHAFLDRVAPDLNKYHAKVKKFVSLWDTEWEKSFSKGIVCVFWALNERRTSTSEISNTPRRFGSITLESLRGYLEAEFPERGHYHDWNNIAALLRELNEYDITTHPQLDDLVERAMPAVRKAERDSLFHWFNRLFMPKRYQRDWYLHGTGVLRQAMWVANEKALKGSIASREAYRKYHHLVLPRLAKTRE